MSDNTFRFIIALLMFFGFFGFIGLMIWILPPDKLERMADSVQNQLIPLLALVLGYYFGTSQGSTTKDKTIADLSAKS